MNYNRHMIKKLFLLFILFSQLEIVPNSTSFYWDKILVFIEVLSNGDFLVTETQNYFFNENYSKERFRYIPLDKVHSIRDITVEENGIFLKTNIGIKNNQQWIKWNHELNPPEAHEFIIKYRVVGGLQNIGLEKSLYWKAVFKDRKAIIKKAIVKVQLPHSLKNKVSSYNSFGAPIGVNLLSKTEYEFFSKEVLKPGEEMEIQINFKEIDLR